MGDESDAVCIAEIVSRKDVTLNTIHLQHVFLPTLIPTAAFNLSGLPLASSLYDLKLNE